MRSLVLLAMATFVVSPVAADDFMPYAKRVAELTKRYNEHLSGDRYQTAVDLNGRLTHDGISNADQVVFRLEPGKKFHIAIEFRGHKEQAIRVSPLEDNPFLIRNTVEASREPDGEVNQYGSYDYSKVWGPFDRAKVFVVEGFSKNCYIGKNCGNQPWWREPVVIERLIETKGGRFWYDDSREPPTESNVLVTVKIK